MAIELKLRANSTRAQQDFTSLDDIISNLAYDQGVFINIDSQTTHANEYEGPYRDMDKVLRGESSRWRS